MTQSKQEFLNSIEIFPEDPEMERRISQKISNEEKLDEEETLYAAKKDYAERGIRFSQMRASKLYDQDILEVVRPKVQKAAEEKIDPPKGVNSISPTTISAKWTARRIMIEAEGSVEAYRKKLAKKAEEMATESERTKRLSHKEVNEIRWKHRTSQEIKEYPDDQVSRLISEETYSEVKFQPPIQAYNQYGTHEPADLRNGIDTIESLGERIEP